MTAATCYTTCNRCSAETQSRNTTSTKNVSKSIPLLLHTVFFQHSLITSFIRQLIFTESSSTMIWIMWKYHKLGCSIFSSSSCENIRMVKIRVKIRQQKLWLRFSHSNSLIMFEVRFGVCSSLKWKYNRKRKLESGPGVTGGFKASTSVGVIIWLID